MSKYTHVCNYIYIYSAIKETGGEFYFLSQYQVESMLLFKQNWCWFTPVSLPGESQGRGSLVGFRLWGRTESDTTEAT